MCVPRITYPSDSDNNSQDDPNDPSEAYLSEDDYEGEETSVAQMSDGVAMLAGVGGRYTLLLNAEADPLINLDCPPLTVPPLDEPTSESDKEMANLCFMDKLDDVDDCETSSTSMALVTAESSTFSIQVHPFFSLSDAEKIEAFDSLTVDFYESKDIKKKANAQIKSLSSQLQICLSQLKHFDKIKVGLEDLKTINFTLAKEKNKLLKRSGLGFGKFDLEPPSDTHAPFSLPSFYESSEENYDNSEPLDSSDLSKDLKFGMFIKAKSIDSPHKSEEAQDSNDPSKPILESMSSLKTNEPSSFKPKPSKVPQPSSNKFSSSEKGKSVADLPPKKKFPKKNSKNSLPIPRPVMLKKLNSKTSYSIPSDNSGKGILGTKPIDTSLSSKSMKVNVTSHYKEAD
ncbi:hypothetical protein L6452_42017 [Arctium lappa]|uniref:Uncharacterized protein n=1 Tax=Arctium lappa TaxID=4217 RepID=A0ACB8XL60_ARCLA|nr:hypothetical protein L6452_42017 [Arctium lappa]